MTVNFRWAPWTKFQNITFYLQVSPLMMLLAFSQVKTMVDRMALHWVAVVQGVALFATILYLAEVQVPIPGLKNGKFHWYRMNIFGQYPVFVTRFSLIMELFSTSSLSSHHGCSASCLPFSTWCRRIVLRESIETHQSKWSSTRIGSKCLIQVLKEPFFWKKTEIRSLLMK